ncbi:MAG: hypothetical protein JXA21_18535 [Anaerolineae bacterium]|nr:hypothetical protein [Anaerolineae bacterium]
MKTKRVGLITLTIVIGAGIVIAILWYTEQKQNMQLIFVEQTSTPYPTLHFTATLVSPDGHLTLPVECSQSQYGAAGPECYVMFPDGARMPLQSVSLPDEKGQSQGSANWSADNMFVVNEDMDNDVCLSHGIWNMVEGTKLDFWLPGLAMTWWSPTGHNLVYVRDIMAPSPDWGMIDAQTGEVFLLDQCPDWLLEYAGNGTEQAKGAAFLCDKVSHE